MAPIETVTKELDSGNAFPKEGELVKCSDDTSGALRLKTHRFIFTQEVIDHLSEFAKIHQHDDRKIFKTAWEQWIIDNHIIHTEVERLNSIGFVGDTLDKMFKSVRYYYRKKPANTDKAQTLRKDYEGLPQSVLLNIDDHINRQIKNNMTVVDNTMLSNISPAASFDNYCNENLSEILKQIKKSKTTDGTLFDENDVKRVTDKLKKTYKNRFYNIRLNINKIK